MWHQSLKSSRHISKAKCWHPEAARQSCSEEKVFLKTAANLQENPCRSVISTKLLATLLKSHFSMGILL